MEIELIPVLKIEYNFPNIPLPEKYPYWDYTNIWDKYHEECCQKAGFKDKLIPYIQGSSLYKLTDISDANLTKIVLDHTQDMRNGKLESPKDTATFWGGYVLRAGGQDKYFPQCCGELSDILYWENLANKQSSYCEGHPSPYIKFTNKCVIFDFTVDEFDEPFQPPPPETIFSIDRLELKRAVIQAKAELQIFEKRLHKINQDEELYIANIGGLLIWENGNYE